MSFDPQTIQTYDNAAERFADHFLSYKDGVDREAIQQSFELSKDLEHAQVIEIGCGAGKNAPEIIEKVGYYEGFDPSEKLLEIAKQHNPRGRFTVADALNYDYPTDVDIIFAFASLIHVDKEDFAQVCKKVAASLKAGGIFCMTLKEASEYTQQTQEDDFGTRLFYLYSSTLVKELVGNQFKLVHEQHSPAGSNAKPWMSLVFVKN